MILPGTGKNGGSSGFSYILYIKKVSFIQNFKEKKAIQSIKIFLLTIFKILHFLSKFSSTIRIFVCVDALRPPNAALAQTTAIREVKKQDGDQQPDFNENLYDIRKKN